MRKISQKRGTEKLVQIRSRLSSAISGEYEHRAKSCVTCETPGECCLDAHFVNVRISRIETVALMNALNELSAKIQEAVKSRTGDCIKTYKLGEATEAETATYACPLFEKGIGCLVHNTAKPLPCIAHACYESQADLPPDNLLDSAELAIHRLNIQTYGQAEPLVPIPLAISKIMLTD